MRARLRSRVVAAAREQQRLVGGDRGRDAERRRRDAERRQRLHQAEAGGEVVGDHAGRDAAAVAGDEIDLVGFEDQVADRQHQAVVADQDARALALACRASRSSARPRPRPTSTPTTAALARASASLCASSRASVARTLRSAVVGGRLGGAGAGRRRASPARRAGGPAAPAPARTARRPRAAKDRDDGAGFMRPPRAVRAA